EHQVGVKEESLVSLPSILQMLFASPLRSRSSRRYPIIESSLVHVVAKCFCYSGRRYDFVPVLGLLIPRRCSDRDYQVLPKLLLAHLATTTLLRKARCSVDKYGRNHLSEQTCPA